MISNTSLVSPKELDLGVKRFSIGVSMSINKEIQDIVKVVLHVIRDSIELLYTKFFSFINPIIKLFYGFSLIN